MSPETKAILKRVAAARRFPLNTTPASRHLEMIADALVKGEPYPMLTEDPEHCGISMLSVLAAFYETGAARAFTDHSQETESAE